MSKHNRIARDAGLSIAIWAVLWGLGIYVADSFAAEDVRESALVLTTLSSIITGLSLVEKTKRRFALFFASSFFVSLLAFCTYANLDANAFTVLSSKRIGMAVLLALMFVSLSGSLYAVAFVYEKFTK